MMTTSKTVWATAMLGFAVATIAIQNLESNFRTSHLEIVRSYENVVRVYSSMDNALFQLKFFAEKEHRLVIEACKNAVAKNKGGIREITPFAMNYIIEKEPKITSEKYEKIARVIDLHKGDFGRTHTQTLEAIKEYRKKIEKPGITQVLRLFSSFTPDRFNDFERVLTPS